MGDTIAQTRFENVFKTYSDPLLVGGNTPRSGEDSMKLQELMELCTNLQKKVLDLEKAKTAQDSEITKLKKRVKKLERRNKSRTLGLKRLRKVGSARMIISSKDECLGEEDASKQGRKIDDIDADKGVTLVDETQGRYDDAQMFDTDVFGDEEVFVAKQNENVVEEVSTAMVIVSAASEILTVIINELTLAQTLAELKSTRSLRLPTQGISFREPSEATTTTTTTTTTPAASKPPHDKGNGIMVEELVKLKKKDQISFDEEVTDKLQAEFDEEARLARKEAEKLEQANIAFISSWDDC
ncbi:hypothetical protein Tco_0246981 [Tanacetum coccineum]